MTLRENAQFIDELRQHYRRLDGLLVSFRDRVSTDELWDVNLCVLALRRLLFGGIGDPNFVGAADRGRPPGEPGNGRRVASAKEVDPGIGNSPAGGNPASSIYLRLVEDAPTAPMSVHDPAEDLEVIP